MAYSALLEDVVDGRLWREQIFRDQQDLLANDDEWLMSRFRLLRVVLLDLCAALGPTLQRRTRRNQTVPVLHSVAQLKNVHTDVDPDP